MHGELDLVLITEGFPYGVRYEPFLESEIDVLADVFRRVFVLPTRREDGRRPLPANVEVVDMPWLATASRGAKVRALASPAATGVLALTAAVRPWHLTRYARAPRVYLDLLARNVLAARYLARFLQVRGLRDAVLYDYWFENATLAAAMVRRRGLVRAAVARAHRFDLYDDAWPAGVVPFRDAKARGLDLVAPVSEHGAAYLRERLGARATLVEVHRLGVRDHGTGPLPVDGVPRLVTCSTLIPRKRVHLVPQALAALGRPVRWIHFGDGPERDRVATLCRALPERVSWELRGQVPNRDVLDFYRGTPVDAFLSLSESEGIPVSMMEAQSFGIPVVAVRGQGVPELVAEGTGVLIEPDVAPPAVVDALHRALDRAAWDRGTIRSHVLRRFLASDNHRRFAERLCALAGPPEAPPIPR